MGSVSSQDIKSDLGSVQAISPGDQAREVLQALPVAVYTTDAKGRIAYFNDAAAELWGRKPEFGTNEWCGSWRLYWPDGRPMPYDQCPMAVALKENRAIRGAEAVAERPDGTRIPFLAHTAPLREQTGALTGAINTLVTITKRKRAARVSRKRHRPRRTSSPAAAKWAPSCARRTGRKRQSAGWKDGRLACG